jgi:hypothetical protein
VQGTRASAKKVGHASLAPPARPHGPWAADQYFCWRS